MEFVDELFPEQALPQFKIIFTAITQIDLSNWNVDLYYEAMGLDLEDEEVLNENDHR